MYAGILKHSPKFFQRNKAKNSVYKQKWSAKKIDSNHPREDRKGDKEEQDFCFLLVADLHLNQTLVMFRGSFINF